MVYHNLFNQQKSLKRYFTIFHICSDSKVIIRKIWAIFHSEYFCWVKCHHREKSSKPKGTFFYSRIWKSMFESRSDNNTSIFSPALDFSERLSSCIPLNILDEIPSTFCQRCPKTSSSAKRKPFVNCQPDGRDISRGIKRNIILPKKSMGFRPPLKKPIYTHLIIVKLALTFIYSWFYIRSTKYFIFRALCEPQARCM